MTHCGPTSAWSGGASEWAESDEMSADCLTLEFGPRSSDAANHWRLLSAADDLTPLARRSKHTLVAYNNSLYVFGGDSGKTMLNDLLKFDIRTAKWSRLVSAGGAPPAPRYHHSAVVFGSSMFVFGGYTADANPSGGAAANSVGYTGTNGSHSTQWSWMNLANKNDLHEFRFSTSTWAEWRPEHGAPFPCARAAHGSAVWNDRLYVFGGYDGNARLNDLWYVSLASPASGRAVWCQVVQDGVGPPPTCNFACTIARDSLFVFSGQSGAKITNRLFKFDFSSSKWSQMATRHILQGSQPPPEKRYGHTMVAFGSQLYVVGGTTGQCLLNELHAYELDTETWSVVQPADGSAQPSARVFHAAAVCGSAMFVFGGTLENNVRSAELFRLQFANYPKCTLHDDFARFLQAGQLTDLLFIVGPERIAMRAHTAFVAARSSVLAEQIRERVAQRLVQGERSSGNKPAFSISMAQASVSYTTPVELELAEVAPQSFALVLCFIYTDRIRYYSSLIEPNGATTRCPLEDDDPANAQALVLMMDVYRLATRFGLARLEQLAQQYFEACVSVRNVLVGVQQAARLGLCTLKEFYLSFIVRESNYQTIIMSKEFETIEQFIMVEIVRRKQRARPPCDAGPAIRQPAGPRPPDGTLERDLDRLLAATLTESQDSLDCLPDILLSTDGALVPAHSALLAARSAYFDALFRSFPPADRLVRVTVGQLAPTRSALESLLRYLYFGNCLMPVEDSLLLFAAPHFFGLRNNRLQAFCKHNLETNVQPHNAAPLLEAADRLNAAEMRRYALSIVVAHLPTVCASPAFRRLPRHLLLDVLDALADSVATSSCLNPGDSACPSAHQPALTLTTVDGHCAPLCAACGGPQPHLPVANRRRVTVASPPPGVQQFSHSSHNPTSSAASSPAASPTGAPPPCDRLTRHARTNDHDPV